MKKCEHIKELILTDYLDGRMKKSTAGQLEGHLLDCNECRTFFKEVKSRTVLPFHKALPKEAPAELWEIVRQGIEHKNHVTANPWEGFIEGLKGFFAFPKLVPIFASMTVMFLVGTASLNTINTMQLQKQAQEKDQGEYLVSLLSPASTSGSTESETSTSIERYFL